MANTKTGLLYSELTGRVYWGTVNTKTNVARSDKKDVTSDFIATMLQKFPVNYMQDISVDGKVEATVIMLDNKTAPKYKVASDMYEMLESLSKMSTEDAKLYLENSSDLVDLLAKARGES